LALFFSFSFFISPGCAALFLFHHPPHSARPHSLSLPIQRYSIFFAQAHHPSQHHQRITITIVDDQPTSSLLKQAPLFWAAFSVCHLFFL